LTTLYRTTRWSVLWVLLVAALLAQVPAKAASTVQAQPVVTGRNYPAMFTVAPDGGVFYSERTTGRIGLFTPGTGADATYFQVPDLCAQSDQGMYGLALHPAFPQVATVYVYATRRLADGSCANQVLKLDGTATQASTMTVLLSDPYTAGHIGGRLLFGPDGDLYASTGDGSDASPTLEASQAARAKVQDVNSLKGKILRITPAGGVPGDNPFGNVVFAYGLRNVFGFDFEPKSQRLWAVDNGPDPSDYAGSPAGPGPAGGCNDELDRVVAGSNQGWGPTGSCATPPKPPRNTNQDGHNPVLPKLNILAASGVTGGRFCVSCGLGTGFDDNLFYVRYSYLDGSGEIHAAKLDAKRTRVVSDTLVYRASGPSPLSIERGPGGTVYFSDTQAIYKLVLA
jgi:glucose/arabinose dehydrogenase